MSKGFEFTILKTSKKSRARLGVLKTPHGEVETPAFVPVATRGALRTLDNQETAILGAQMLIANTFHLHLTPGEKVIKKAGGLHKYMNWNRPIMTDSGGFQVFSFGFGRDHGVGKILKDPGEKTLEQHSEPKNIKITEDGVEFPSPIDGHKVYLSPKISIEIQQDIGADIMFAFDECPSPLASAEYMRKSIDKTHRWAQLCLDARTSTTQALYGIVQGGSFKDMRIESATILGAMEFDGYGIGGEFGYDKESLALNVSHVTDVLPQEKPRHLLGVGHPEDFPYIMESGADTFDCIAPTHYARHGTAFTSVGRIDLKKATILDDMTAIDPNCDCPTCQNYSRSFVGHLIRAKELTGMKLATIHNVYYLNKLAADLRNAIKDDTL